MNNKLLGVAGLVYLAVVVGIVFADVQNSSTPRTIGGGSTTLTDGVTATSGCTAGGILHSVSNLVECGDTDIVFSGNTLTVTNGVVSTLLSTGGVSGAANTIDISGTSITAEGSGVDTNETTLAFGNATADGTVTLTASSSGYMIFGSMSAGTLFQQRIYIAAGTVGAPSLIGPSSSGNDGLYEVSATALGFASDGVLVASFGAVPSFPVGLRVGDGTAAAPSFGFSTDTNTGLFYTTAFAASPGIAASVDGVLRLSLATYGAAEYTELMAAGNAATTGNANVVAASDTAQTHALFMWANGSTVPGTLHGVAIANLGLISSNGMDNFMISAEGAAPIRFFTNSTERLAIGSTGNLSAPGLGLTAGTMTAENAAQLRTTTSSYTWTNAQVVALGASTTGDITVATLPAKTVVKRAFVVIITPDTSANALTVACGRTGATYVDYVVASDAKAAANTVYGDSKTGAETGANLYQPGTTDAADGTFVDDLASYTATTDVKCHFIKTTTNLDTVTGSTGRVILETELLP